MKTELTINGAGHSLDADTRTTLLDALRNHLGLTGTKKGCDHGQCGACTVIVNGRRINSCLTLACMHDGDEVTTIEGLADGAELHPVQTAFREHHGLQCGFCTPGMIMTAVDLIRQHGSALDEKAVRDGLEGNICRCTGYHNIVKAILAAAGASQPQQVAAE